MPAAAPRWSALIPSAANASTHSIQKNTNTQSPDPIHLMYFYFRISWKTSLPPFDLRCSWHWTPSFLVAIFNQFLKILFLKLKILGKRQEGRWGWGSVDNVWASRGWGEVLSIPLLRPVGPHPSSYATKQNWSPTYLTFLLWAKKQHV